MIKETTIYDFKTHLSRYIAAMEAGEYEKIIVKRRDKVVGEFHNPFKKQDGRVRLGMFEGQMSKEQLDWLTSKESDEMVIEMFEESINKDEDW